MCEERPLSSIISTMRVSKNLPKRKSHRLHSLWSNRHTTIGPKTYILSNNYRKIYFVAATFLCLHCVLRTELYSLLQGFHRVECSGQSRLTKRFLASSTAPNYPSGNSTFRLSLFKRKNVRQCNYFQPKPFITTQNLI